MDILARKISSLCPRILTVQLERIDKQVNRHGSKSNSASTTSRECSRTTYSSATKPTRRKRSRPTFRCEICSLELARNGDLKRHQLLKHTDPIHYEYVCSFCSRRFMGLQELKHHVVFHLAEKPFSCTDCDKAFKLKTLLSAHVRRRHSGVKGSNICQICYKCFHSLGELRKHGLVHELDLQKEHGCQLCSRKFLRSRDLQRHVRTHTAEKDFRCSLCTKSFREKLALTNHTRTQHTQPGVKPFKCTQCSSVFSNGGNLSEHVKHKHVSSYKTFVCPHCKKLSATKRCLEIHVRRIHTQRHVKPFSCTFCPKTFKTSSEVKSHINQHTAEKPYSCSTCKATFATSGSLRQHMKVTHDPELKRISCQLCPRTFKQKHYLRRHMRWRHEDSALPCPHCDKICTSQLQLSNHVDYVHLRKNRKNKD